MVQVSGQCRARWPAPGQVRRMSLIPVLALAAAVVWVWAVAAAPAAQAQTFGARVGDYTNAGNAFVGGELLFHLPYQWSFDPNVEVVFVSHGHLVTANFDALYDLPVRRPLHAWVGGGPAVVFRGNSAAGTANSTDFGFDVLTGLGWRAGPLVPYVQAKALLSGTSDFVVAFGVRF
jgi:hypothetical protein